MTLPITYIQHRQLSNCKEHKKVQWYEVTKILWHFHTKKIVKTPLHEGEEIEFTTFFALCAVQRH